MVKLAHRRRAKGAGDQLDPRGIDRRGKGNSIGRVHLLERPRRQDDEFIDIRGACRVGLGPAHHDPVGPLLNDVDIVVGVHLLRGQETAVALCVGLGHGQAQVALLALAVKGLHPRTVSSTGMLVQMVGDQIEGEERVGANFLD